MDVSEITACITNLPSKTCDENGEVNKGKYGTDGKMNGCCV